MRTTYTNTYRWLCQAFKNGTANWSPLRWWWWWWLSCRCLRLWCIDTVFKALSARATEGSLVKVWSRSDVCMLHPLSETVFKLNFLPFGFVHLHPDPQSPSILERRISWTVNQTFIWILSHRRNNYIWGWLGVRYEVSSHLSDRLPRTVMGIFSVIYCKMRWGYHAGNRDRKRGLRM